MAKAGRPKIGIDKTKFEYMCSIMAKLDEIAGLFDCSEDTIERWCKRTYKDDDGNPMKFADVFKRYSANGKISLRRAQWESAKNGNVTMQIWLGKNWLGQADRSVVDVEDKREGKLADLIKGLKASDDLYTEATTANENVADKPTETN